MNIRAKVHQARLINESSKTPLPMILDMMRVKRRDYVAECRGLAFELEAGTHEWFTVLENILWDGDFIGGIKLNTGDTVIDIGANFGSFAAIAANKVGPKGKVVAYEPNPNVYTRLTRNMILNKFANTIVKNEAVGGTDGEINLLMQKRSALTTTLDAIDDRVSENSKPVRVKVCSINRVISEIDGSIDLLKIDCEGAEYEIFDALNTDMMSKVRQVAMEVHSVKGRHFAEIIKKLEDMGFIVHQALPTLTAIRRQ